LVAGSIHVTLPHWMCKYWISTELPNLQFSRKISSIPSRRRLKSRTTREFSVGSGIRENKIKNHPPPPPLTIFTGITNPASCTRQQTLSRRTNHLLDFVTLLGENSLARATSYSTVAAVLEYAIVPPHRLCSQTPDVPVL